MTKAKTNRLLLLGVLLIALLTMAMGFGISANAAGEPEIYWTSVVDPDGAQLGNLEIGCTGAAPQRGLHFSTTDDELIIETVGQLYLRGSADEIQRLSLGSVTAADITLMDCGLANAVMSLNAGTKYDIKLRLAEGTTNYLHSIAKADSNGSLTISGKGMLSLARIYGDPLTNVTFDGCVVTVDATTVGGSTEVPAIGCDVYYSPEEINNHVYNIVIKNGASVKATGNTGEDQMFGNIYGAAIGGCGAIIHDDDASYKVNGSEATVYNGEGQPVVLMEIDNPTEADVRIDGVDVFDKHGDEKKIYAYVTAEDHIVDLGDTVVNYTYGNGGFDNYIHGTQFVVSATNSGETLIYGDDYTYTEDDGVLTIMSDKAITIANADDVEVSNHHILVAQDVEADITLNGVNIDVSSKDDTGAFAITANSTGDVTVTLADGSVNVLKSGSNCAGLQKNGTGEDIGMLTICGTGSLSAQGGTGGAGIGGGRYSSSANITITDKAAVTATGSAGAAGIGGGFDATLEDLIISGGSVNAVGSTYSDSFYGDCPAPAIGSGVQTGDYVLEDGDPVTPTLADGTTPVYLLEIDNPNGEDIVIDDVDYPDSHGSETKIYAYVTAENHTVKVGNTSTVYEYNNGSFIEFVHGTQFSVSATKSGETLVYGKDYTYSQTTKVLKILSDKAITIANANGVYEADDHIIVAKNVNADITLAGVNINVSSGAAFAIDGYSTGNVTVTLAKGSVNILQSGEDFAGINKNDDESTLTITGEGSLTAQGGAYAPGIGAEATSNITIKGGNITATGGDGGAGIGGGYNGSSRNITITGTAVVTATGYGGAAGIGGGYNGTLEDIFITGGSVKAVGGIYVNEYYGKANGAPIGGGVFIAVEVLQNGDPVTPTLADGTTRVYLFEISNPNGEDIVIDGVDFPDKHGDENKIYAYVTLTVHTIKAGDTLKVYEYLNGAFTEMVHGTDLSVSATNSGETLVHGVDYTYSSATGILTVLTDKAITIANADGVEKTDDRIIVEKNADANITLAGVNINAISGAAFTIADNSTGDVTLTLADGSVNTLKGASFYAGLQKNGADENVGTLTICGTGSLSAQGGTDCAGIGGTNNSSTGNITISGGAVVTATGGVGSAGIGGGHGGSAEDITITDNAVVTASGKEGGAGIGGGKGGSATNIKISDNAVVTASGKEGGAGIGGGADGTLKDIIINGGSVNAIGSNYYEQTVGGADSANIGDGVILPSGPDSEPEEGAPVTPTLADGTTPVYLFEIDNPNGADISIDGVDFPDKHGDEKKIYAYVTGKNHIVKFNDTLNLYVFSNGSFAFEDEVKAPILKASTTSDNFVKLSWNNTGDTISYEIYRSATGSDFVKIATADGTAYTDTTVVAGNRYYYQIKAYYSEYDVYVVSDIEIVTVLDVPVIVKVTYGDGTITLTWNKVAGADHYSVHLMNSPAFDGMTDAGNTAETTITLNDVPEDKYLVVCALDTETAGSSLFSVSVPTTIPVPENISTEASDKQVTLKWDAVGGATKYAVYCGTDAENLKLVSDTITDTTFTVTELVFDTEYYFAVKAYMPNKWSELSDTVNVTTEACKHGNKATEWTSDNGYHWHKCIDCEEKLDVTAHTAGDWIIDTEATTTTEGRKHKECTVCGVTTDTATIDKLPHNSTGGGSTGGSTGGGSTGGSTSTKPTINGISKTWADIAVDISKTASSTISTVNLNGNYDIPEDVIKAIADTKAKVTFVIDSTRSWVIDGSQITNVADVDLRMITIASLKTSELRGSAEKKFRIDGFNVPSELKLTLAKENAGKFANLYKKDGDKLVFVDNAKLDADGNVMLSVSEDGDYAVMLCEFSDRKGDVSNNGVTNALDAAAILKDIVALEGAANPEMRDYNGDGKVNVLDASAILKDIVNSIIL